jgi:predicted dehydrogenase
LALPIVSQPAFIKKALAAGKHVLSEKPVAPSIADAAKLLDYSKSQPGHWSVAENFRFLKTFAFARQEIIKLGKVLHFRVKVFTSVTPGGKYFETSWRKTPEYQGGFLLDGGVHFVAGIRELLGGENRPKEVVAFSQLLKEYLPPVDSVDSVWKCESGVTGTVSISFGTSLGGDEYEVACENGSVVVSRDFVTVRKGDQGKGEEEKKEFAYELGGVKAEVAAWAEGIQKGECNVRQSPEEAVADLECLEAMLTSGDRGGEKIVLSKQV